jgi:hypothetical protein
LVSSSALITALQDATARIFLPSMAAEFSDGFVVRLESTKKPRAFDVAASVTLKDPEGPHRIDIAADEEL